MMQKLVDIFVRLRENIKLFRKITTKPKTRIVTTRTYNEYQPGLFHRSGGLFEAPSLEDSIISDINYSMPQDYIERISNASGGGYDEYVANSFKDTGISFDEIEGENDSDE